MKTTYSLGEAIEIGVDEAGRGCFWGPVFAGAVIWPPEDKWTTEHRDLMPFIKDSKKITEKRRPQIAAKIKELALAWGVGRVDSSEINEHGMTWANQEAFRRAIADCIVSGIQPTLLLIDGILGIPGSTVPYQCIPGGDNMYLPIAAASILAKVGRDKYVEDWSEEHEEIATRYDLLNNKGYGTGKHRQGLKSHGPNEFHRSKFIRNWL
ncbi:MAG: ribonuclease HII [Alphaproteobacteria bacterium]|nr:ribonuclease HII [Alphaproteobacteria bacterium]